MSYLQLPKFMTKFQQPVVLIVLTWLALPRLKAAWIATQEFFTNQTCGDKPSLETKINNNWKKKQLISKAKPGIMGQQAKFKRSRIKDKSKASACSKSKFGRQINRQGYLPFREYAQRHRRGSGDPHICNTPDYEPLIARIKPQKVYSA